MANVEERTEKCRGCQKLCSISKGASRCPDQCQLCNAKKCSTKDECQCNACTCGCQDEENKDKSCKDSSCVACKVICKGLKDDQRCRCTFCDCGCQNAFDKGELCHNSDSNKCSKCKEKCKDSKDGTCICYLCSCGCNGVNCQCCVRCNSITKCKGKGTCDGEEKHGKNCPKTKCAQKPGDCIKFNCICPEKDINEKQRGKCECKCRCEGKCPRIMCPKYSGKICPNASKEGNDCNCKCECSCNAFGIFYDDKGETVGACVQENMYFYSIGGCRFKCTNCGRLCDQDRCMNWIRVIVIGLIILASLFVLRAIFPQKFRAIMTKIRATFASSPAHSGRSLNNLVGRKFPEETNVDRYPAFRPRAYAGLS